MVRTAQARLARQLLGSPVLPPGAATRSLDALRRSLARARRRLAPAPVQVLDAMAGLAEARALGLLVALDVPDRLTGQMTANQLAAATGTDPDALERLLRFAAGRGFVSWRAARYRPNGVTRALRRDDPGGWRAWVELADSDWWWEAWRHAEAPVRGTAASGVAASTGVDFFELVHRRRPDAGATFDAAVAAGGRLQGLALAAALPWGGVRSVCDVGGGTGAALGSLLEVHPHLQGTLLDLPEVVERAEPRRGVTAVGGDAFTSVPPGHDRYLLLAVVHDWDDDEAAALLRSVARAAPAHGEVVVVEWVLPDRPSGGFEEATDLQMLVVSTGRERSSSDYHRLWAAAGLGQERSVVLATGATAFVLRPTGRDEAAVGGRAG